MRTLTLWCDEIPPTAEMPNITIWSMAYKPDGSQIIVAAGNRVLVYDSADGKLLHSLKGHRDTVYAVTYSKHGKRFASGGADNQVIIWNSNCEGWRKYNHKDSIQCLAYNPVTQQLASGTASDIGFWAPEQKSVVKHNVSSRVLCLDWTPDGQNIALGHFNGDVSFRDSSGIEKWKIQRGGPVWCLKFNPATSNEDTFVVGSWDQTVSFWKANGEELRAAQKLEFDPCALDFLEGGDYFILGGSDQQISLWSREGVYLSKLGERNDWLLCSCVKPNSAQISICVGCNSGSITSYHLIFSTIHGLYKDRYSYRNLMTGVIVQNLSSEKKVRIRCKDYVRRIAVYRNRLAVHLTDKVLIYEVCAEDEMKYKIIEKIRQRFDCSLLVVTSYNVVLCRDSRLELYSFKGVLQRTWILESLIRYIKVVGGPPRREGLLVGLKDGQVQEIFIDNPFPLRLMKQSTSIRCVDLSRSRTKLALVDEQSNLLVFETRSKRLLYQEPNATSVAWNTGMEDMLAFSGNNVLKIKTGNYAPFEYKLEGFVVGFEGSKVFCLHSVTMKTIDLPQSAALIRYMEDKCYDTAYEVACLGVTEADWRALAVECLINSRLDIARKGFTRIRDIAYLDLLDRILLDLGNYGSSFTEDERSLINGRVAAFQERFVDAAQHFNNCGRADIAVEMYTDLKKWNEAKKWAEISDMQKSKKKDNEDKQDFVTDIKTDVTVSRTEESGGGGEDEVSVPSFGENLILKQAEAEEVDGDLRAAGEMYLSVRQYKKAADIFIQIADMESLIEVVRQVPETDSSLLGQLYKVFKSYKLHQYSKETILRLSDMNLLLEHYIEIGKWEESFELITAHPNLSTEYLYLSWASWLLDENRFDDAIIAYHKANRRDMSIRLIQDLVEVAICEKQFKEAAVYTWKLAVETINNSQSNDINQAITNFWRLRTQSEVYFAYQIVYSYVQEPFTTLSPETVIHSCLFIWNVLNSTNTDFSILRTPLGVSQVIVLYAVAKQASNTGMHNLSRLALKQLETLRVPTEWQLQLDLAILNSRVEDAEDQEDLQPICSRCSTTNPLLRSCGDCCINCCLPFTRSFSEFDVLPVVEFQPQGISNREAITILEKKILGCPIGIYKDNSDDDTYDPFIQRMVEMSDATSLVAVAEDDDVRPLPVDIATLQELSISEVLVLDFSNISIHLPCKFFKMMIPEAQLIACPSCLHTFHQDSLEVEYLQNPACPFCASTDIQV
eukprot:GHVL01026411.1.p1 GENE.GHVL01026411.1~~GHVL01026411.1.p1  ORF type:complete len:1233 (+),score=214.75 GHVL01026411.1:33-3731(+)